MLQSEFVGFVKLQSEFYALEVYRFVSITYKVI